MQRSDGSKGGTSVAALRAQMHGSVAHGAGNPAPPPKKNKTQQLDDIYDERAVKAERQAQAQHQTSLLTKMPKHDRLKPVEKKRGAPFVLQLLLVLMVAGGVAVALDPALMAQVRAFAEPQIDRLREMLNV